jgi:hypothetical protein
MKRMYGNGEVGSKKGPTLGRESSRKLTGPGDRFRLARWTSFLSTLNALAIWRLVKVVTVRLVVANIMSARTVLACKTCLEREAAVNSKNAMQLRMTPVWMALETFMVWGCGVWRNVKKGTVFRNSCWTGWLHKMGIISELRHNLATRNNGREVTEHYSNTTNALADFTAVFYCNFRSD